MPLNGVYLSLGQRHGSKVPAWLVTGFAGIFSLIRYQNPEKEHAQVIVRLNFTTSCVG